MPALQKLRGLQYDARRLFLRIGATAACLPVLALGLVRAVSPPMQDVGRALSADDFFRLKWNPAHQERV